MMLAAMKILIDETRLRQRVAELGAEIRRDAGPGVAIHMVAALKGAFVFLADLIRATEGPVTCDFIGISSYGAGTVSAGDLLLRAGLSGPVDGRHVLIVEDIVDTGRTLARVQEIVRAGGAASIRTVGLLDKPSRRVVDVTVDYVGFTIDDHFVVGYGLDFNEQHRNLPYIAVAD
jgi:hypoxanthine phosphoribosyltransferase